MLLQSLFSLKVSWKEAGFKSPQGSVLHWEKATAAMHYRNKLLDTKLVLSTSLKAESVLTWRL